MHVTFPLNTITIQPSLLSTKTTTLSLSLSTFFIHWTTTMATRGLVLYLLTGFSAAILSVFLLNSKNGYDPHRQTLLSSQNSLHLSTEKLVWPVNLSLNTLYVYMFLSP